MKDQVGFFNALLGTCRGTEIFPRLCRNSWGRTVLHLFLLSVFCAFAVTLVQAVRTGPEINRFATGFFDAFGNLKFNAYGRTRRGPTRFRAEGGSHISRRLRTES